MRQNAILIFMIDPRDCLKINNKKIQKAGF